MKKSLVALAALAATTAFAQSSVTLYGNLDQSVFRSKADSGWLMSSNSNGGSTSLWGITGTEDLGGGLKASFDLKSELTLLNGSTGSASTGFALSTNSASTTLTAGADASAAQIAAGNCGAGTIVSGAKCTTIANTTTTSGTNANVFNRGANITLAKAGLGEVKIGRQNDAWWETSTKFNNTGLNSFGWANATAMASGTSSLGLLYGGTNLTSIGGLGANSAAPSTGATNTGSVGTGGAFFGGLSYATPVFNGFQFKMAKGAPKAAYTQTGDANNISSYSLNYSNGPLTASWAQQNRTDANAVAAFKQTMVGIKYVMGQYTLTYGNNATRLAGTAAAEGHNADVNAYGVGYALSPAWNLDVGYTVLKDKDNSANKWTQTAVVGKYALSKRTTWYVGAGRSANAGSSRFGGVYAGNGNSQPPVGTSETTIITGIKHAF